MSMPPAPADIGPGKAIGSIIGGAIAVIVIFLIDRFIPPPPLPDYVTGAIQTLIVGAVVYYTPHWLGQKSA